MDIAPPVPLPRPGQYEETPFPVWKLKTYEPATDPSPIFRVQRMPVPEACNQVYSATEASTVAEMRDYARWLVGQGPEPRHNKDKQGPAVAPHSLLRFNSRFESGNLLTAFALSESEYQLYLSPDTNSKGHIQWFYFSVTPEAPVRAKLHIMNFMKAKCLFARGMRPWCRVQDGAWERTSFPCTYYPNGAKTSLKSGKEVEFYTLSFEFEFKHTHKPVFFAFSEPYLYTTLQTQLRSLSKHSFFKRQTLCLSTLGFPVDLITITSPTKAKTDKRDIVVLTARVHPGETPGSLVMESVLKWLCEEGKAVRDKCVFKLVPMLNPDGVIIGNSRTGVEGADLNRRWRGEETAVFPQLAAMKGLLRKWQAQGRLALFCDLHGHAKACNAFLYGCSKGVEDSFSSYTQVRLFPRILSQLSPFVNYSQCSFKVHKSKSSTARVVIWRELGLTAAYTLESSFYGYTAETGEVREWGREELAEVGRAVVRALGVHGEVERDRRREVEAGGRSQRGEKEHCSAPALPLHFPASLQTHPSVRFLKSASSIRSRPKPVEEKTRRWRAFFEEEELQRAREGKQTVASSSSGSESDPSEDNLAESEVLQTYSVALLRKPEGTTSPARQTTEAIYSAASLQHSITEETWFTRSSDKFDAGKPQDFLFRSISYFKSISALAQPPSRLPPDLRLSRPKPSAYSIPPSRLQPLYRPSRQGTESRGGPREAKGRVLLVLPAFKAMDSVKVPSVGSLLGRKTGGRI